MNKIIEDAIAVGAVRVIEMPCEYFKITEEELVKFAELQRARVVESEPVGYVRVYGIDHLGQCKAYTMINSEQLAKDDIPLYTHPDPKVAELEERLECNTTLMHSRTEIMNKKIGMIKELEAKLNLARDALLGIKCSPHSAYGYVLMHKIATEALKQIGEA
jgi:hypothetical protein